MEVDRSEHELVVEPISPIDALYLHGHHLTDFEREEILDYRQVYYVGPNARKIDAVRGSPRNAGYDDATGRYRGRLMDHIGYRYKICSTLGKGAFGDCFKAYDFQRRQYCALKIIRNEPRFHRQAKVEVNVLEMLKDADPDDQYSLVHHVDNFLFRGHLIITFELLGNDLYSELRAGGFAGFPQNETKDMAGDILRCLELLGRVQVVHADLKPENILLRPNGATAAVDSAGAGPANLQSRCKVIDFGSSCFQHGKIHTYIQSRYYRSPEVVLGLGYGPAIDMWSLGCILVELDAGAPLFSAKNEADLLLLQLELLGLPSIEVLARAKRAEEFFSGGRPLKTTDRKGRTHPVGSRALRDACRTTNPEFLDFVSRCLTWDPADRMTPLEALEHPWLVAMEPPKAFSSPKFSRVTDLIQSEGMDLLNDSGVSSGDEQEVPDSKAHGGWSFQPSPMSAVC